MGLLLVLYIWCRVTRCSEKFGTVPKSKLLSRIPNLAVRVPKFKLVPNNNFLTPGTHLKLFATAACTAERLLAQPQKCKVAACCPCYNVSSDILIPFDCNNDRREFSLSLTDK